MEFLPKVIYRPFAKLVVIAVLLVSPSYLYGFEGIEPLHGRIFSGHSYGLEGVNENRLLQNHLTSWLEWDESYHDIYRVVGVAEGRFFYNQIALRQSWDFDPRLRELWASIHRELFEIRVGQQIIPWGKTDGIQPTDYLTAKDFGFLYSNEEVKRIGAESISFQLTPFLTNKLQLEGVFQAKAPRSRILIPGAVVPAGIQFETNPIEKSQYFGSQSEWALKLSYPSESWDLSLSFFSGRTHNPVFYLDTDGIIRARFPKQKAIGADASWSVLDGIFRFESALKMPNGGQKTSPDRALVQPWYWDGVLGYEREIISDFRVILQGFYRHYLYSRNPLDLQGRSPAETVLLRGVAQANGILLNAVDRSRFATTLRLSYDLKPWSFELGGLTYLGGRDYVIRPALERELSEGLKTRIGMDKYGGPALRPLGALKSFSQVYAEIEWLF